MNTNDDLALRSDDLGLRLSAWMRATAPAREPAGLVLGALDRAASVRQRPAFLVRTGLRDGRFVAPVLSPRARLVLVAAILVAALAGSLYVGAQLLRDLPRPSFSSDDAAFAAADPVPDRMEVSTTTLLPDGRVLIGGPRWDRVGVTGQGWIGWGLDIWDPASGTYEQFMRPAPAPALARAFDKVIALADGRVLVIDGWDGPLGPRRSADVFDPGTGRFTPVGSLVTPRLGSAAIRLNDGRVLVTGGEPPEKDDLPFDTVNGEPALATSELFDPASDAFAPTGAMVTGRVGHALAQLADGRILVIGGSDGSQEGSHALRSAEIFDPSSGSFSSTGDLATARAHFEVPPLRLGDGRVLVIGGSDGDGAATWHPEAQLMRSGPISTEIYDPATGRFSPGPSLPDRVSTATLLRDGLVLVTGTRWESHQAVPGRVPESMREVRVAAWAGLFDPRSGTTREIPPLPGANAAGGTDTPQALSLADGRVMVIEGWDPNDHVSPEGVVGIFEARPPR